MNYRILLNLLFVFTTALSANELELTPENIPPAFSAEYDVVYSGLTVGKVTYQLTHPDKDTWIYTSTSKPQGLVAMFSGQNPVTDKAELKLMGDEILPIFYERDRKTSKGDRSESATYIWDQNIAKTSYRDRKTDIDLSTNIIDKFTIQLLIMANAKSLPDYMLLPVIAKAKVKEYEIINYGPETIDTVYGERDTIKVERKRDESSYIIWADSNAHGLPIQIQKMEDGKLEYTVRIQNSTLISDKKSATTNQQSSYH